MEKPKPHITKKKERLVNDLVNLMKESPVIGVIDMTGLPALQFQRIKSKLSDKLDFRMVKKRLIKIAFDKVADKKNIDKLKDRLEGIPALIFTKEDPFKLAKVIKKEVSQAPAKAGQIAPEDIILPAGPTPFMPGPMIGELGAMGIKSKVEGGKINIVDDKVLVKKGEEINGKIADLLSKLGIEPMQVGFNLLLTYKDGEILEKDILFVDEKLYLDTLQQFARECDGLAIYIGYICKDSVGKLLGKAYNDAKAVADTVKLEEKMEEKKEKVEAPKEEEKPAEEPKPEPVEKKEEEPKVEEKSVEQPKEEEPKPEPTPEPEKKEEESKPEPIEEHKEEPKEVKVEESKPEPTPEPKEESKKEPQQEEKTEEQKPQEEVKVEEEKPVEEAKEEEPKPVEEEKEEVVEEEKEETKEEEKEEEKPKEEKKEETLNNVKDIKVGLKPAKDITKDDIDLAAKQLQEIQDKIIKGGK